VGQEPADLSRKAREAGDDYTSLLIETLCDRLVEAFAEKMFYDVRTTYWGYAPDEVSSNEDLIASRYRGIRPAIGYPSCPDHSEKERLFSLLEAEASMGNLDRNSAATGLIGEWFYEDSPHDLFYNICTDQ
jgi:5-methyltetrahydrofolate--homocysteine methyltransferase